MSFIKKENTDGSVNPKYVDLLDEDRPVANQKFACISFVSPEDIIENKNLFRFEEFLKHWEFTKMADKYTQFLNFISYKYNIKFGELTEDLQDFIKSEKSTLVKTTILDDYKNFLDVNEDDLDDKYNEQIKFQTAIRGLKIRGVYPTQYEAEMRCKVLREIDPHHDVYVGPVGMWMPWHPDAYKTGKIEYMEDELNQLMHEKKNNEVKAKQEFDTRVRETKENAIEENKKKAAETGNKLTQNIDKDGNLYSVNVSGENNEISVADIRKELFDHENVVIGDSDHGLSQLGVVTGAVNNETVNNETVNNETVNNETVNNETVNNETSNLSLNIEEITGISLEPV